MAALKDRTCAVICAGSINDYDWLREKARDCFVICADAGYLHAQKAGITPDVIIGDFDSAEKPVEGDVVVFPVRKDSTDAALAIEHGVSLGYRSFSVYGAISGSRLDHTVANLVICAAFRERSIAVRLVDEKNEAAVLSAGTYLFERTCGKLSVFAFGGDVTGLTEQGVSYPLKNYVLRADNHLGVSNEIVDERAEISFKSGFLLVIRSND